MEERKNNFGLGIFIGILIALVIGLAGFFIYDKVLFSNEQENNSLGENELNSNNEVISLNVSDSVVQETYNDIMPWGYSHSSDYFYHVNDKLLVSDISNENKMEIVFQKLSSNYKSNLDTDVEITNDGDNFIISEDKIINIYKQLFGDDKYEFTAYKDSCPSTKKIEDGRIEIGTACGDAGMPGILQEIVKAEKTTDELYIYETVGFLKFLGKANDEGQDLVNLYRDDEYEILVSENEGYYDDDDTTINLLSMKDKLGTYKYTFKSNGNGTYHFYSVEKQ